ncbi:hypothetical protein RM572_25560 [Streptomyces sp. DSM 42041]|uniref:Uncharacterized protein n=1 Tax=Streptomyces hazeniae TaxID=3075538 RepID=A0ABU2P0Y9_9ACTN|nr:hypothetical protein [Streptomyces sp. DSM 42041]MDT0382133.1 hypothetical protein [Streptomyces sp. DSM 42041]
MGVRAGIADRWSEHLHIDYLIAATVVGTHVLTVRGTGSGDWLKWIDSGQRTDLYAAAAGVVSAIGGLSAIAISIYTAAHGARLRAVRGRHSAKLRQSWRSLLQGTALVCLLILSALSLDREKDPMSARFVFEYAMVFAGLRFGRLVWLFDTMMRISDADLLENGSVPTPVRDPHWLRRQPDRTRPNP